MIRTSKSLLSGVAVCAFGITATASIVVAEDSSGTRVTHVLGLKGIANNAGGSLTIQDHALQFRKSEGPVAQIGLSSIVNVSLGQQDKQVGGVPMTLGKAAAPFGGGRVVSLFSHKKFDTLTVEYLDADGGLHGAIFQLNSGQGQMIKDELVEDQAAKAGLLETSK
jgi:hypothetical protein